MADPKYANLPGIDLNSPDVYETSDLPEDDQHLQEAEELNSESVEKIPIDTAKAFDKFKGSKLDGTGADFGGKIGRSRNTGYDIPFTEYEIMGQGSGVKETPQQKYQRLQVEMRELAEEVKQVQENIKADAKSEALSPVVIAKQVEYLQQQLTDLHIDRLLGQTEGVNLADPQGMLQKRLMSEIQSFRAQDKAKSPGKTEGAPSGVDADHVTYQLYYRPEQAKFSNNAKLADIEQRIERIEAVIGNNPEKMSLLTSETTNKSLVGAVALLQAKSKLLDPAQLEHIEGRLYALNQRLTSVADKKEKIELGDKATKVGELYEMVKKWDALSDTLPQVVGRLTSLKDLHEQALQFSQALTHLDTSQQQIETHFKSHGDMLKTVESTLKENMDVVKNNCDSIDKRLKELK